MKTLAIVVAVVVMLLSAGVAGAAEEMEGCSHDATIQSLRTCIEHAAMHGHIDNAGIAKNLLAMVDAAQAALDRGRPTVAVALLAALSQEVGAQAGIHIAEPHASHLQAHIQMVIDAIQSTT